MRAKFGVLKETHDVCLPGKFRLTQFILSPSAAKTPNFAAFGFLHFVLSPDGDNLRKLNTDAQVQTFPYPRV